MWWVVGGALGEGRGGTGGWRVCPWRAMTQLRKPHQDPFKNKDPAHILIAQGPVGTPLCHL